MNKENTFLLLVNFAFSIALLITIMNMRNTINHNNELLETAFNKLSNRIDGEQGIVYKINYLTGKYYELDCRISPISPGCEIYKNKK